MVNAIEDSSYPLEKEADLDALIERAGDSRAVLIGEATHGTSEFYEWRATITRRLIEEKGFSFVAVEGDWPDCYEVNRYVKNMPDSGASAYQVLNAFSRWPTWMWANLEVQDFIEWLAERNESLPDSEKVGFYGLDMYSLWESLSAVTGYLEKTDPAAARIARDAYRCFEPYRRDVQGYAWAAALVPESCEDEIVDVLSHMEHIPPQHPGIKTEEKFSAEQNALVAVSAERYYRTMLKGGSDSWNLRDEHMADTFIRLLTFYEESGGPKKPAKGIIWAHNTHVGDARATDMVEMDEFNIGQLMRERLGRDNTYLIGFGTHSGSVIAAYAWDAPMQKMAVPPAKADSWEDIFHGAGQKDRMILFPAAPEVADFFSEMRDHRAVGVVYDPGYEFGNYVPTVLSDRYDAFLYIDETSALHPLHIEPKTEGPPETFPSAA